MSEQEEQEISQIIDTGLESILSGKMTLEQVLEQHPDQAELIRSEIEPAMWLVSKQSEVAPRAGFVNASRKRVVERIKQEASQRGTKRALFGFLWPPRFAYRTAAALVIVFMLLIASGGVVSASQRAVPGDGLYDVKRFTEQVAYQVTLDPVQRVTLRMRFSERRLSEAQTLIARSDTARANIALEEYQKEVQQAVADLEKIPDTHAKQKGEMAALLQDNLGLHAEHLQKLKESGPGSAMPELGESLDVTKAGISDAGNVFNDVNKITPTVAPTATFTEMPSETAEPSSTPMPGLTSTLSSPDKQDPGAAITPQGTQTVGAGNMKPTPTPTVHPTKTPKPTVDNKNNAKPDVPPGQDKNPGSKPPKEDPPKKDPPKADPPKKNPNKK